MDSSEQEPSHKGGRWRCSLPYIHVWWVRTIVGVGIWFTLGVIQAFKTYFGVPRPVLNRSTALAELFALLQSDSSTPLKLPAIAVRTPLGRMIYPLIWNNCQNKSKQILNYLDVRRRCFEFKKPASKLSYLGERSEPRENAGASGEAARGRRKESLQPSLSNFHLYFAQTKGNTIGWKMTFRKSKLIDNRPSWHPLRLCVKFGSQGDQIGTENLC